MDSLFLFSAGSENDRLNKDLWVKGASLFIPQINNLLNTHTKYRLRINSIDEFEHNNSRLLGDILAKNKSDKSTTHRYYIFYSYILNKLGIEKELNTLEIGLGTNNPNLVSTMGVDGRPGASLYSFKEYLPNSNIHGADIDKDILFEEDRIKTCYVDQLNSTSFEEIKNKFGDIKYDLIIDDGLHSIGANFNTLLFALENLKENGWVVIEDIIYGSNWQSIDFILNSTNKYKTYMIATGTGLLYAVNML